MRAAVLLAPLLMAAAAPPLPPEKPAEIEAPKVAPGSEALPPYQDEVEHLAALLGTLTVMRDLCGAGDGARWRAKMEDLLAAEGATPIRRDRLAGAYNEGLSSYAATYRQCTPAAGVVIDRALAEAARLSRDLATRYGG